MITYSNYPSVLLVIIGLISIGWSGCQSPVESDNVKGKQLFEWQCTSCHGLDGSGGSGPSLHRSGFSNAASFEDLLSVIRWGIPGTEMPGSWQLSDAQIKLIAEYVQTFPSTPNESVKGNIENGLALYHSTGVCASCHTITGQGGNLGPELSHIGSIRSPTYLKELLLDPGSKKQLPTFSGTSKYLLVSVITNERDTIKGMRINEDAFSIQLKTSENEILSFRKKNLLDLQKHHGESLMPSIKDVLTDAETNDLVVYLSSLK